jgi:uncharacterized protein YjdB
MVVGSVVHLIIITTEMTAEVVEVEQQGDKSVYQLTDKETMEEAGKTNMLEVVGVRVLRAIKPLQVIVEAKEVMVFNRVFQERLLITRVEGVADNEIREV